MANPIGDSKINDEIMPLPFLKPKSYKDYLTKENCLKVTAVAACIIIAIASLALAIYYCIPEFSQGNAGITLLGRLTQATLLGGSSTSFVTAYLAAQRA